MIYMYSTSYPVYPYVDYWIQNQMQPKRNSLQITYDQTNDLFFSFYTTLLYVYIEQFKSNLVFAISMSQKGANISFVTVH